MIQLRLRHLGLLAGTMLILTGCDPSKTETGYTPKRVGMSNNEIRSLYAPAFSPEAHTAEQEKKSDISSHRPGT